MAKKKVVFEQISPNEFKFKIGEQKFMLAEQNRGVYGIGKAVQLYSLDGVKKVHLREIGWTKKDNHNGENEGESVLNGIQTWETIKEAAVEYAEKLLA